MPFVKSSKRFGKKAAAPSAKRAAAKKLSGKAPAAGAKSNKKQARTSGGCSSLKQKQKTVERMKRAIWAQMMKINDAIISAATRGNLASARELFHFAGVYSLPNPDEENAVASAVPVLGGERPAAGPAMVHPIDEFFSRIGVEASRAEPEPEAA